MKKIFLLFCVLFLWRTELVAQFSPGDYLIGANIGMTVDNDFYESGSGNNSSEISIGASGERFVTSRFSIGARISYMHDRTKESSAEENALVNTTGYHFGPYCAWHLPVNQKLMAVFSGEIPFEYRKSSLSSQYQLTQTDELGFDHIIGINLSAGLAYMPAPRWIFSLSLASIQYSYMWTDTRKEIGGDKIKEDTDSSHLGASCLFSRMSLGVGFKF